MHCSFSIDRKNDLRKHLARRRKNKSADSMRRRRGEHHHNHQAPRHRDDTAGPENKTRTSTETTQKPDITPTDQHNIDDILELHPSPAPQELANISTTDGPATIDKLMDRLSSLRGGQESTNTRPKAASRSTTLGTPTFTPEEDSTTEEESQV